MNINIIIIVIDNSLPEKTVKITCLISHSVFYVFNMATGATRCPVRIKINKRTNFFFPKQYIVLLNTILIFQNTILTKHVKYK